jgi:hypothetical protein
MLGKRIVLLRQINHSKFAMDASKELQLLELATIGSFHAIEESMEDIVALEIMKERKGDRRGW